MPHNSNTGADMDSEVQHNDRSRFSKVKRKLLKPKNPVLPPTEQNGSDVRGHQHRIAGKTLRATNSNSHRSSKQVEEPYSGDSERLAETYSQPGSDTKRRGSMQANILHEKAQAVTGALPQSENDLKIWALNRTEFTPNVLQTGMTSSLQPPTVEEQEIHSSKRSTEHVGELNQKNGDPKTMVASASANGRGSEPAARNGGPSDSQELQDLKDGIFELSAENTRLKFEKDDARRHWEKIEKSYKELEGDLSRKNLEKNQLQQAYNELESVKNREIEQTKEGFQREMAKWQRKIEVEAQLKRENGELRDQLQKVSGDVNLLKPFESGYKTLQSTIISKDQELSQRDTELERRQALYEDLQNKYGAASDELNRLRLESRSMLDDRFFATKWSELQVDIKQWAHRYFWGMEAKKTSMLVQRPQDQRIVHEDLLRISDDCKGLIFRSEDGSGRSTVTEAYLWSFIEENILDSKPLGHCKGFFWAHSQRSELCRMEEFLRPGRKCTDPELRIFQKWKASTAKLIISRQRPPREQGRLPVHPNDLQFLIDRILGVLGIWRTGDERDCARDLQRIIISAIDIDSHMNEQWSIMYATTGSLGDDKTARHGFPFDSTLMEPASKDFHMMEKQLVGIVVSPALIRSGTANGDQYESTWVLAKSRVLPQGFTSSTLRSKMSSKNRPGLVKGRSIES